MIATEVGAQSYWLDLDAIEREGHEIPDSSPLGWGLGNTKNGWWDLHGVLTCLDDAGVQVEDSDEGREIAIDAWHAGYMLEMENQS